MTLVSLVFAVACVRQETSVAAPLQGDGGTLALSLEECVRQVLDRNLDLRIAKVANQETLTAVEQALGAFDPELYATATGADTEQPTASVFQPSKNQSLNGNAGLRGLLRSGLTYDLDYALSYNRQSPTNPFFLLNPTFSSTLALNLTQPLLRGAGATVNEAPVEQARLLVARGGLTLYTTMQDTAFQAVQGYWVYVLSLRKRDTAKAALDVALELVDNNKKRLAAGTMTRLDVTTAEAEAARRRAELIRAENAVGRSEDALKSLLSPGDRLGDWTLHVQPTTEPHLRDEPLPPEEDAVVEAFTERSDLHALEVDERAADLSLEVAENQSLPKLNLLGSYGYAGLSGQNSGADKKSNVDLWGDSLAPIRDRDFRQWSLGFDFSRPLGNRRADAGERKARLDKQRAQMTRRSKRMGIVQELRSALRDVADARAGTEAAREARVLAEEQYAAELTRLENQHSTTFQVREAQRDMFQARDAEIDAITTYEISLAALDKARGILARRYGFAFEEESRVEGRILD